MIIIGIIAEETGVAIIIIIGFVLVTSKQASFIIIDIIKSNNTNTKLI